MDEIAYLSVTETARRIQSRQLSSRELLDHLLARVERSADALNAVVTLDVEGARRQADAADAALARGESTGPLHGVPMTIKDTLETAGMRTTAGFPPYAEHVPATDAVVVARLRAAGAIVFGKTNVPVLAGDWQSFNPVFGTTNNPWNVERTPGGSSGGSAAALAAGLTPLEVGSDIGGSIRVPAHWCGVYGHKPTHGILPCRGHVPGPPGALAEPDLAVVGPLARTAEDLELAVDLMAGPLPEDAAGWRLELPAPRKRRLQEFRVLAWLDDADYPVDASVRERLAAAVDSLRAAGVTVDEGSPAGFRLAPLAECYQRLLWPILMAGYPEETFQALAAHAASAPADADGAMERMARFGTATHRDWLAADETRAQMRAKLAPTFEDYDLWLMPVNQVSAIGHDHLEPMTARTLEFAGGVRPYVDLFAWISPATLLGLPATAMPAGLTAEGLPVGVQLAGPRLGDRTTMAFARLATGIVGEFQVPPAFA
jgi:amidase